MVRALRSGRWLRGSGTEADRRSARSGAAVECRVPRARRKPRAHARHPSTPAVASARAARWIGPERNERRPGPRPERALVTVEIRHAGIAAQHVDVGQIFGRVNLVTVEATHDPVDHRAAPASLRASDERSLAPVTHAPRPWPLPAFVPPAPLAPAVSVCRWVPDRFLPRR